MPGIEHLSKFFSYVLRHAPESIGLELDAQGWASIEELIVKGNRSGQKFDRMLLQQVVATSEKKRFTLSQDGTKIRAAQGHSVQVDLAHAPVTPPDVLFHGTATRFLDSIRASGLKPGLRRQVHLSKDEKTAVAVGQRHGKPCVLQIDAKQMHADGHDFYQAENGVWLTDHVPVKYLLNV